MDTPVSCPVCTLYLREGVSLQDHLNTHPKDQVIEALLKYYTTVNDGTGQNDVENVLAAQYTNEQTTSCAADSPAHVPSQQYPCGSSHFTAAVTYQQFMSSNASVGGTVLPQCFSVPAIITTTAGDIGPATLMPLLYNPYVVQQQQQQLQFYNTFRTIPQQPLTRQILSPSTLFPISSPFSVTTGSNTMLQNNVSVSSSSVTALESGDNVQTNSSVLLPTVTNGCQESNAKYAVKDSTDTPLGLEVPKYKDSGDGKQTSAKHVIQCMENQENEESIQEQTISSNKETTTEVHEDELSGHVTLPSLTGAKNASSNSTFNSENSGKKSDYSNKSCESVVNDDIEDDKGISAVDTQCNPVSPGLRVRTDLSKVSHESDSQTEDNKSSHIGEPCVDSVVSEERNMTMSVSNCGKDVGWECLSEAEKSSSSEVCISHNEEKESSEYITSDIYPSRGSCETESINRNQLPSATCKDSVAAVDARHFNVVDIEGIQVLVPSHFLAAEEGTGASGGHESVIRTSYQQSRFRDQPVDGDTDASMVINQDIQTDEVMPAMGELSGQESLGENDTIPWSQEKDDISTSYDLLAREKWEASDGSDEDNDGELIVRPVTSKLLQPSLCSAIPVDPSEKEMKKSKKKEKLKCLYKCWTCDQTFTCPKERRVHQSERHAAQSGLNRLHKRAEGTGEDTWHSARGQDCQQNTTVKQEQCEEEKIRIKSESEVLAEASDEIEESKTVSEVASKSFDDDCLKEMNLEEQSREEENAFKFICSRCENVFASAKSLHHHVRTAHGQSQFTCRTCSEKFPTEATYLAHLKVHPLECSRCGKYFYRHQNLNLHIRRHLGIKPFKCSICDKSFVTKQKLAEHTNTHTGNTPIKCNLCTETFRRYSNLIQHKNRHHLKLKKKVKDFICHCGEIFHSQKKLQWHKEIHDEKPKTCNYCSERFVHASSLTRHIRKAHDQRYFPCQGRESENVECPICGCVFLKSSLAVHMRLHSGERPFNCHICGKNFSTKWNLQLHRWTHASRSLKPYKCSLCKSAFIRHSEYTSHMHSHRNVRPYTCNYCGSQFIRKYNCIRHAREHEGEKPFSCNICQKSFHRRYYLKEHMRIHSGVRPFACHICGKTSSTKSNHNKHVKIHHAREAINTEG